MQNLVMGTYCIEQLHGKYETINGWFLHVCNSELVQQRKQCRSRRFPRRAVVSSANLLLFALSVCYRRQCYYLPTYSQGIEL